MDFKKFNISQLEVILKSTGQVPPKKAKREDLLLLCEKIEVNIDAKSQITKALEQYDLDCIQSKLNGFDKILSTDFDKINFKEDKTSHETEFLREIMKKVKQFFIEECNNSFSESAAEILDTIESHGGVDIEEERFQILRNTFIFHLIHKCVEELNEMLNENIRANKKSDIVEPPEFYKFLGVILISNKYNVHSSMKAVYQDAKNSELEEIMPYIRYKFILNHLTLGKSYADLQSFFDISFKKAKRIFLDLNNDNITVDDSFQGYYGINEENFVSVKNISYKKKANRGFIFEEIGTNIINSIIGVTARLSTEKFDSETDIALMKKIMQYTGLSGLGYNAHLNDFDCYCDRGFCSFSNYTEYSKLGLTVLGVLPSNANNPFVVREIEYTDSKHDQEEKLLTSQNFFANNEELGFDVKIAVSTNKDYFVSSVRNIAHSGGNVVVSFLGSNLNNLEEMVNTVCFAKGNVYCESQYCAEVVEYVNLNFDVLTRFQRSQDWYLIKKVTLGSSASDIIFTNLQDDTLEKKIVNYYRQTFTGNITTRLGIKNEENIRSWLLQGCSSFKFLNLEVFGLLESKTYRGIAISYDSVGIVELNEKKHLICIEYKTIISSIEIEQYKYLEDYEKEIQEVISFQRFTEIAPKNFQHQVIMQALIGNFEFAGLVIANVTKLLFTIIFRVEKKDLEQFIQCITRASSLLEKMFFSNSANALKANDIIVDSQARLGIALYRHIKLNGVFNYSLERIRSNFQSSYSYAKSAIDTSDEKIDVLRSVSEASLEANIGLKIIYILLGNAHTLFNMLAVKEKLKKNLHQIRLDRTKFYSTMIDTVVNFGYFLASNKAEIVTPLKKPEDNSLSLSLVSNTNFNFGSDKLLRRKNLRRGSSSIQEQSLLLDDSYHTLVHGSSIDGKNENMHCYVCEQSKQQVHTHYICRKCLVPFCLAPSRVDHPINDARLMGNISCFDKYHNERGIKKLKLDNSISSSSSTSSIVKNFESMLKDAQEEK